MASDYADDVATALDTDAGLSLTLGTNLFRGKMRAYEAESFPRECVACEAAGGPAPQDYCNGNTHTPQMRDPVVQVMVRGDARDYSGGETLARAVWDSLHDNPPSGYIHMRCMNATPLYVGEDEDGSHLWSINVALRIEE